MIGHADLLTSLWGYALLTAAFTLNKSSNQEGCEDTTWYVDWAGVSILAFMRILGCEATVKKVDLR